MTVYYKPKNTESKTLGADELLHWGVKGQRWGIRRYQNKDGSLTPEGKKRLKEGTKSIYESPSNKNKNRKEVVYKMDEERNRKEVEQYETYTKEHPNFKKTGVDNVTRYSNKAKPKTDETYKKDFIERFVRDYADATLRDLNMKDSPQTRQYLEQLIRDNELWKGLI